MGLSWGIPTAEIPHRPFHPDEVWEMRVLSQLNPEAGDFLPEEAFREGPVSAYVWVYSGMIARQFGFLSFLPYQIGTEDIYYASFVSFARGIVVFLDILSVALIFFSIRLMTPVLPAAVLGSLALAVCPFEIIYSRFMRTHTMANFFACLVMFFSAYLYRSKSKLLGAVIGLLIGVSSATRYPTVIVGVVPGLMIIFARFGELKALGKPIRERVFAVLLDGQLWALLVCSVFGFLFSAPAFLFNFDEILPHLQYQAKFADTKEFSFLNLFSLFRLLAYVIEIIPYGTYPLLWLLFYGSVFFLLFRKSSYRYSIPLLVMLFGYLYGMGKGYLTGPLFIRAVILMFPGFAILFGLAVAECFHLYKDRKYVWRGLLALAIAVLSASAVYDISYGLALERDDPRIQLYKHLKRRLRPQGLVLGQYPDFWNYFVSNPTLEVLKKDNLRLEYREDFAENPGNVNYVLVSAFEGRDFEKARTRIAELREKGKFVVEQKFENPPTIFGRSLWFESYPHDLSYPFPTLYLLRRSPVSESRD